MIQVSRDQLFEAQVHDFIAEASTLGLPPGTFPESLTTDAGNGQPFLRQSVETEEGNIVSVRYRQALGCISLTVLND